ncbi:MAG: replicative DNA helicase [Planctomycetota bacterium]
MDEKRVPEGRGDAAQAGERSSRRRDAVRRTVADPAEVARLFSALPPAAPEAEMSLLGAMLVDPKVIADVIGIVSQPDDFAKAGHGTIFQHMVALYDATATLEIVSLVQRLKDHGVLEDVGGSAYLMDLAEGVASAANAPEFARLVREKATLRELIRAAGEILVDAHQSVGEASMVLGEAEARIFAIAQRREARSAATLRELLDETVKMI